MKTLKLDLPDFWAFALQGQYYGNLSPRQRTQVHAFEHDMLDKYGSCVAVDCTGTEHAIDDDCFRQHHFARAYGVKPCHVLTYTFDISSYYEGEN